MDALKEIISNFLTSSIVTKILVFISAFFAPAKELYLLLLFLVVLDWMVDVSFFIFKKDVRDTKKIWDDITKVSITKIIMYSILMLSLNSVQIYLIKDLADFYKIIMAVPILAELLGITQNVEKSTGISITAEIKNIFDKIFHKKE